MGLATLAAPTTIDPAFEEIERRRKALRLTKQEMIRDAGISRVRYWRAETGVTTGDAVVRVVRETEALLDKLEAEKGER